MLALDSRVRRIPERSGVPRSRRKPWWVRTREVPTLWVDDAVYGRFDKRRSVVAGFDKYVGQAQATKLRRTQDENVRHGIIQNKPGYTLKDRALATGSWVIHRTCGDPNTPNVGLRVWQPIHLPEVLKGLRYEGDAREASSLMRAAARVFGAAAAGITTLDRRHVYSHESDGKEVVFEDVLSPYEDEEKRVIPESCRYVIVMAVLMSRDGMARAPSAVGSHASRLAYSRCDLLLGAMAEFIRCLGYTAIPSLNDTAASIPYAVQAGLGELGRSNRLITPWFGPMVRLCKVFTNLPMECDTPVEFGVVDFCKECGRCAESCPVRALSFDREPSYEVRGEWNNPGHLAWFEDSVRCYSYFQAGPGTNCGVCFAVCPFNKPQALFHTMVKSTIAMTDAFNRPFVTFDKLMGYGRRKDPESWWRTDLREYGI